MRRGPLRASAPGKAMLAGEYAVLLGAPAVCAAVERAGSPGRAAAWLGPARTPTPLARAVARAAAERLGLPPTCAVARALARRLAADTSALRLGAGGPKLGLGSSSAAAAAMAAVALAALGGGASEDEVLAVALDAHRALTGGGSGADVAACVQGGVVLYRRDRAGPRATPLTLPPGLDVRLYFAGAPSSTGGLVRRVLDRAGELPVARALAGLGRASRRFIAACRRGDVPALLSAVRAHGRALGRLGAAAGLEIVTPALARLASLADEAGGAAKPSGAGGGDVAVVFAPDRATGARIAKAAARSGLTPLDVRLGARGAGLVPSRSHPQ